MEEIRDKGSVRNTLDTVVNLMKRYVSKRHVPQLIPLTELPNVVEDFYIEEKVHRVRKQVREVLGEEEGKLFSLLFLIQFSPYDGLVMRRKWGDGMSLTEIAQLTYDDMTKNFSKHQTYVEGLLERLVKEGFVTKSVKGLYKALSDASWVLSRIVLIFLPPIRFLRKVFFSFKISLASIRIFLTSLSTSHSVSLRALYNPLTDWVTKPSFTNLSNNPSMYV